MEYITIEWLTSLQKIRMVNYFFFAKTFMIYKYKSKIGFIYVKVGAVDVLFYQANDIDGDFEDPVLLGRCTTQNDIKEIFRAIVKENLE